MGDHSKKLQRDVAEREQLERGKDNPSADMPCCHCGAVAVIHVSRWHRDEFYCAVHAMDAQL
jgi:hypothetical protein